MTLRRNSSLVQGIATVGLTVLASSVLAQSNTPPGERPRPATTATELVEITSAERQPNPGVHTSLTGLMDAIETDPDWSADYVRWEMAMLAELGFGLDVAHAEPGAMISSRSGEPVPPGQLPGAGELLLPLPEFLRGGAGTPEEIVQGLALTGLFIERALDAPGRVLPSRTRLVERLARLDTTSGVKSGDGREGD